MAAIAAIEHGIDPSERHTCIGGYRLGSRFFRCLGTHGSLDMPHAIMKSCNSYFYWVAHRLGYDAIAPTARLMGLGEEFQLAGSNQRFGTIPDSFVLAARPDGLAVVTEGEGIPARLGLRTYLGRAYQYRCETAAGELVANGFMATPLETGSQAVLAPQPEQCCILAPEAS